MSDLVADAHGYRVVIALPRPPPAGIQSNRSLPHLMTDDEAKLNVFPKPPPVDPFASGVEWIQLLADNSAGISHWYFPRRNSKFEPVRSIERVPPSPYLIMARD